MQFLHNGKNFPSTQEVIVRELHPKEEKYKYSLVAGSRRYNALVKAGKTKIRAIVNRSKPLDKMTKS